MLQNVTHPLLVLIRGLPGSGKSYLAAELQRKIGTQTVVMLDPDATDYDSPAYLAHTKALTAEGVDPKLHAYRFLRAQAYQGIEDHKVIIWNQPFTNLEIFQTMIGRLQDHAAENNTTLPLLVVEVEVSAETAKARVLQRKQAGGHGPSENTFARFMREYTTASSLGYPTVQVSGDADTTESVTTIMQALEKLIAA
jgi:adenylate kinase family enzyme